MEQGFREIRLYPNRRLYDPVTARYVTFDHVYALIRNGNAITVREAAHGTDVTHRVLVDILVRQELNSADPNEHCLTEDVLRELIRAGESDRTALVAKFLDHSVQVLQEAKPK